MSRMFFDHSGGIRGVKTTNLLSKFPKMQQFAKYFMKLKNTQFHIINFVSDKNCYKFCTIMVRMEEGQVSEREAGNSVVRGAR